MKKHFSLHVLHDHPDSKLFKLLICLGYVFTAVKEISLLALTPCTLWWFAEQGDNH